MKGRPAVLIGRIDAGPLGNENADHLSVAVDGGQVQSRPALGSSQLSEAREGGRRRRRTPPVLGVDLGGGAAEEEADGGDVAGVGGQVERDDPLQSAAPQRPQKGRREEAMVADAASTRTSGKWRRILTRVSWPLPAAKCSGVRPYSRPNSATVSGFSDPGGFVLQNTVRKGWASQRQEVNEP